MSNFNTHVQTDFTNHIDAYLESRFLDRLEPQLHLGKLSVQKKLKQHSGNTVKWNRWDNPAGTVTPISDGVSPDGISLTSASITATADQYGEYATTSDRLQTTAINDTMKDMTDLLAFSAAQSDDFLARNELDVNGTQKYADGTFVGGSNASKANVESGTDAMRSNELRGILKAFRVANVPTFEDGLYRGILHPIMEDSLLAETAANSFIILAANTSNSVSEKGEIGVAYGIKLMRSTNVRADATSTNTYGNIFLGNRAYGSVSIEGNGLEMIVKPKGAGDDPLNQRATMGYKFWQVYKILEAVRCQVVWAYGV